MSLNEEEGERKRLDNALRRILRTDSVSPNPELLRDNLFRVCDSFNSYYAIVKDKLCILSSTDRKRALVKFANDRLSVERCLERVPDVGVVICLPLELGEPISFQQVPIKWKSENNLTIHLSPRNTSNSAPDLSILTSDSSGESSDYEELSRSEIDLKFVKMNEFEVIKTVNSILKPFSGAVAELDAFIINIKILERTIPQAHISLAIECIRGKLLGTAAKVVPESVTSFADIRTALISNIIAEPSSVVEARLAAIRFDNENLTKFSEDVEKAASLLFQTFISEGIPINKSNEMTIAKVVETCRRSARNDLVRSVLASSTFDTPKAVLSKFITEVADQNKDKQFLAFRQQHFSNRRGQSRSGGYYNPNYSSNNSPNNYQRHPGGFNNSNFSHNNSHYNGNSRNYYPQNRGGFRGNGRGHRREDFSDRGDANVRVVNTEELDQDQGNE